MHPVQLPHPALRALDIVEERSAGTVERPCMPWLGLGTEARELPATLSLLLGALLEHGYIALEQSALRTFQGAL
ncbi:MAG: hypothetical protein WA628_00485 [Terriglobales bacterium]